MINIKLQNIVQLTSELLIHLKFYRLVLVALSVALGTATVLNVAEEELSSEQQEEVRSKFRE